MSCKTLKNRPLRRCRATSPNLGEESSPDSQTLSKQKLTKNLGTESGRRRRASATTSWHRTGRQARKQVARLAVVRKKRLSESNLNLFKNCRARAFYLTTLCRPRRSCGRHCVKDGHIVAGTSEMCRCGYLFAEVFCKTLKNRPLRR